jgi:rRNA maturation endonuclease Nob1
MRLSSATCVFVLVAACQSTPQQTTTVDRVLIAPNIANAPYSRVLVVAAVPRRETARNIEQGFSEQLKSAKVEAHSFVRESSSTEPSDEAVSALVEAIGADGVIIVTARLAGTDIRKVDEKVEVDAETQGGNLFGYFRYNYKETAKPSYSEYTVDVILTSDFFDAESGERVYSMESSTQRGGSTYDIVMSEGKVLVGRLKQDGLIR